MDNEQIYGLFQLQSRYQIGENIFKYNTDECLTLVLEDNSEIPLCEYAGQNIVFLNIKYNNAIYTENFLIGIGNNHYISKEPLIWQDKNFGMYYYIPNFQPDASGRSIKHFLMNDLDGFKRSFDILRRTYKEQKYGTVPAFIYADNQIVTTRKYVYSGYVPSIGQLIVINRYIELINHILTKLGTDTINISNTSWLSSTEYSNDSVWRLNNGFPETISKQTAGYVFPLFASRKNLNNE